MLEIRPQPGTIVPSLVTRNIDVDVDYGTLAIKYLFSTATADADPGPGTLALNGGIQNAATVIRADLLDADGADVTALLDAMDDSESAVKGHIRLSSVANPNEWLIFKVSSIAAPSGYRNITVAPLSSSTASPFADGEAILFDFTMAGDRGTTGTMEVDTLAELAALTGMMAGDKVLVGGRAANGDGGGGVFYWDAASTATEDGAIIVKATALATGRWFRIYSGPVDPRWYGMKFDGLEATAAANLTAINAMIAALNAGTFRFVLFPGINAYGYLSGEPSAITAGGCSIRGGGIFNSRLAMASTAGTAATFFRVTGASKVTISGFTLAAFNFAALDGTKNPIEIDDGSRHLVENIEVLDTAGALTVGSASGVVQQSRFSHFRGNCAMHIGGKIINLKDVNASQFHDFSVAGQNNLGTASANFAGLYCVPTGGKNIDGNAFHRIVMNMPNDNSVECKNCYIDATNGTFVNFTFFDCIFDQGEGSNIELRIGTTPHINAKIRGQFLGTRATSRAAAGTFNTVVLANPGDKLMDVAFIGGRYNGSSAAIFNIDRDLGAVTYNNRIRLNGVSLVDRSSGGAAGKAAIECNAPGLIVDGCYVTSSDEDVAASYAYLVEFDQDVESFQVTNNYAPDLTAGVCKVNQLSVTLTPDQIIRGNATPFRDGELRRLVTTGNVQETLGRFVVPNNTVVQARASVTAIVNGSTAASYERVGTFRASGGVAALIGSVSAVHSAEDTVGWDVTMDFNLDQGRIRVNGGIATTITWRLNYLELSISPA